MLSKAGESVKLLPGLLLPLFAGRCPAGPHLVSIVWLVSIPFWLTGISVREVFDLLDAIIRLPARALRGNHSLNGFLAAVPRGSVAA